MAPDGAGALVTGHLSLVMIMGAWPGNGNMREILTRHQHCFRSSPSTNILRGIGQNNPIKRNFPLNVLFRRNQRKDQTDPSFIGPHHLDKH